MKKLFLFFFLFLATINWPTRLMAQSSAPGNSGRVIDIKGNPQFGIINLTSDSDTTRCAVITYHLPDITLKTRVKDGKIFREHTSITVDSIMDTIRADKDVSNKYLVAAYSQAGQSVYEGPTFTEKQKNVGFLLLKKQKDYKQTDVGYKYRPDKKYVQMIPLEVSSTTIRWDWLLIIALSLFTICLFILVIINKDLNQGTLPTWISLDVANLNVGLVLAGLVLLFIILCCQWKVFGVIVIIISAIDTSMKRWKKWQKKRGLKEKTGPETPEIFNPPA